MDNARELYKQKYQAQLQEWSAKADALKAHAEKLTAEAKIEAHPHLESLQKSRAAAEAKLHELGAATDEKWEELKKVADGAWNDLKSAVEGAHDAIVKKVADKKP